MRRDPGRRRRERSWEISPQEAAPKETRSPKRFQGGGGTFHGDAGGGVGGERGTSDIPGSPGPPPPQGGGREEGTEPTGKAKPGKRCSENKARRSRADTDTDTQAQEQERKGRRHSLGPPREKQKNSTWVETVTKSKDDKHKLARPRPAPAAAAGDGPGSTPPGRTTPGTADAPAASVRPPGPRGAGDAGRRGHGDRPAAGRPGDPTRTRAEPTGAGCGARRGGLVGGSGRATGAPPPSASSSTRRRRRTGGGETDDGSGPRHAREARRTGARPRGAADGEERTEAGGQTDGRTERGTDGVQPPEAEATEPAAEAGWPRATARATAQNGRGGGERAGRQGAPRDLTARGLPAQGRSRGTPGTEDWRHHPLLPSRGSRPPPPTHTHGRSRPGRTLSRRAPAAPHGPHARNPACLCNQGSPPPLPQGPEGTAPPGDATGRRTPGDDTHVRRGRLGPGQGEGARAAARAGRGGKTGSGGEGPASTHGRGRGAGARVPPGEPENTGDAAGPPGKPARDPTATHTRGRSRDARDAGQPPPPAERAPRPGPAARSDPEARHPGDTLSSEAAQTVTARRHRLRLGGEGGRDRQAPPRHGCGDWGKPGPDRPGVAPPLPPPSPWARTTGAGRARARRTRNGSPHRSPDTPSGARRDPPPTRRGEARAAVGKERQHGPTAGPAHPSPPPAEGRRGKSSPPTCSGSRHGGHCALGRGGGWGVRYPKAPSRIAREGFLTEGAPSLTRASLFQAHGGAPRAAQALSRAGGVCGTAKPTTHTGGVCTARAGAEPAPRPPQGPSSVSLHDEGEQGRTPAPLSYRLDPPQREPTHGTHSPPRRGPEEDTGLRETTPPLGLRHLRDNLERSRGTTEEQPRGTLTHPRGARERGSGTALPTAGEAKREHLLCQEDQRAPAG
ncbi:collagen alpha-1(I) chain-like [Moschus berezovskii]|uniref:collagen alpha-1(I) chain-like n=1 Tax=Moschus berezovskii TaxID=68408 RepID=UPI002443FBA7|nr:collagen alpha-1(I) chain-like [Moschus berezovskii]